MALHARSPYRTVEAVGVRWTHVLQPDVSYYRNEWLFQRQVVGFDSPITNIGALVYCGHDDIEPGGMFGMHPHQGIEVISYILGGRIEHEDTTGAKGWLVAGELGHMVAGKGVRHSERNPDDELLSLFQIFVLLDPEHRYMEPSYQRFDADALPVESTDGVTRRRLVGEEGAIRMHMPVEITRFEFEPGGVWNQELRAGDECVVYADRAPLSVSVGGVHVELGARDELVLELSAAVPLSVHAEDASSGLIVTSPALR